MSSRALRRLQGELDLINSIPGVEGDDDENTDDVEEDQNENVVNQKKNRKKQKKKQVANPFELLAEEELDGEGDPEPDEDDEREEAEIENKPSPAPKAHKNKKKKKKKKAKEEPAESQQPNGGHVEDKVEAGIAEASWILGTSKPGAGAPYQSQSREKRQVHDLLGIEYRHLIPENELKRKFGSRVVQGDRTQSRQRNRNRPYQRSCKLVTPKETWPVPGRNGLSMSLLETRGDRKYFAFEHSAHYQKVQFRFLDAVESLHPQNISDLLREIPYHIDSLIQLSEVFRMGEDMQNAADLIVCALYGCEAAFHPLFNLASGKCYLDYRRPENRSFYICLFKHLQNVGQRACYRTALEFCKLILSLDPDCDPLCVLLMIDFYALRAEEYNFLIQLFHSWERARNLSQLPNFAFSVPLAMFHAARGCAEEEAQATAMLEDSLLMFPGLLMLLLDKCGVQPDPQVASHAFFGPSAQAGQSEALRQLLGLYVGRCFSCWKEPDALRWLEDTVRRVLTLVDDKDPRVEDFRKKCATRYQGTPRNILRHIILSDIKDATAALPPDMAHAPVLSWDPLPPTNSIVSYSRPERRNAATQSGSAFTLFLRSLLPNYDPNAPAGEEGEVAGAEGGQEEDGNAGDNLRRGVAILMDTMRDLLHNIRPVDPPVENQHQGEGEEEQDWNEEDD